MKQVAAGLFILLLAAGHTLAALQTAPEAVGKTPRTLHEEGHHEEEDLEHGHEESIGVEFENNDEMERTRNYKKVSEDLAVFEEEYSKCIKDIPDEEYTQEKVDECVGRNFIKVVLDIKYVTLKVMARLDTKVRKTFIKECYELAGTVEEFSEGCDVMERDVIDMLWNGLEFVELVEINKEKYLFEYGKIPNDTFRNLFGELEELSKEFFDLLNETDSHKEVIILRLKTLIDDRTKVIQEKEETGEDGLGHDGVHHTVEITETIQTDGEHEDRRKLNQQPVLSRAAPTNTRGAPSLTPPPVVNQVDQPRRTRVEDKVKRNNLFRKQMVNKLSDAMVRQARAPFKNIHTAHYSRHHQ